MTTSTSDAGADPFEVRLTWPGAPDAPPVDPPDMAAVDAAILRPMPAEAPSPAPVDGALRRVVVDAYDRLADRVLERLRALREDLDADLTEVRSELATLRQAVDDVGDRVQLRQMRAAVDELRSDIAGLRRTVLEWPELERVSADVTALRADVSDLTERAVAGSGPAPADPELLEVVAQLSLQMRQRPPLGALTPVVEELAAIRTDLATLAAPSVSPELAALTAEVASLRRRISLRATTDGARLPDDQLDRLADAVAARLASPRPPGR